MQDKTQRRAQQRNRRSSSASAILSGKKKAQDQPSEYLSYGWIMLFVTFVSIALISFLFTPYTHQLDEIKNVLLQLLPPFLLGAALWKMDFSAITWKRNGALILLGLYIAWMCVSWVVNPYKPVGEAVIWFNLGVATFAVIFAWYMNSEDKIRKTMIFFVLLSLASTIFGLFLYAGRFTEQFYIDMANSAFWQTPQRQPWSTLLYTFIKSTDMYSFILNSDFYAAFLVMLIPIALSMFFVEQRVVYKTIALLTVLLMNVCLFLTNSNDSFLAIFLITYPLYFLVGWRYVREWNLSRRVIITFASCTAVLLLGVFIMMLPKLSATYDFKSAAFEGRRVLWGGGFWPWLYGDNLDGDRLDIVSIIFGTGPGGYRHYFPWFRRPDFFDNQIDNVTTFAHNFYLDVLLETGLVGLILFMGFVVRVFADGIRQIRTTQSRTHLFYQLAVLSGLAGIALQNFSSPNNRWAVAGMIYWSLYGLSMGLVNVENQPVPGENQDKKIGQFPIYKLSWWAALSLTALFFIRCVFPGGMFYHYWQGATNHALGVRAMDYATYAEGTGDEEAFYQAAVQRLEEAINHNPLFATSYYKLGHAYNRVGVLSQDPLYNEKAIRTYEELDRLNPNYSEVHLNLGIMYAQKAGSVASKRAALEQKVEQLEQEIQSARGRSSSALQADLALAKRALEEMQGPEDEVSLKFMEKAYDEFSQAAHQSIKPNTQYFSASTGRELARMYEAAGETEKAAALLEEIKKYYRSIINYKPKRAAVQADQKEYYGPSLQYLLALCEETGDYEGAIEVLKQMVADNPDSPIMLQALLAAYDRAELPDEKRAYLEEAVDSNPTDAILRMSLAEAHRAAGQQEEYLRELRRVEVLSPNDPELLQLIHDGYAMVGDAEMTSLYAEKLRAAGVSPEDNSTTDATSETTAPEEGASTETVDQAGESTSTP